MMQEENYFLFKNLCARLPYRVRAREDDDPSFTIIGYDGVDFTDSDGWEHRIGSFKPYLRRMSSMTDKEKIEFNKLVNLVEERCINAYGKGGYTLAFIDLNNWLNSHHFDYCGFIDKGLALEAKEGMYEISY